MTRACARLLLALLLLCLPSTAEPDLETLLRAFDAYVEKSRLEWGVPGVAVAIVKGDQIVYARGFGVKEVGRPDAVTPDTVFQIGSITKSFTATLVGQLVDEGQLEWSDRVVDRLPDFRLNDPWFTHELTIEDTMAQRSGLASYAGDFLSYLPRSRADLLQGMRRVRPVAPARSRYTYLNNIWLVPARVIESSTGLSWEESTAGRIFIPLAMTSSSASLEGLYAAPDHATPHVAGAGGPIPVARDWPFNGRLYRIAPAGGINSSARDMARYARLHLHGEVEGKTLLSPATLARLHTPHTPSGGGSKVPARNIGEMGLSSYCLGWLRQELTPEPLLWHSGGTAGCKSTIGLLPESDVAIVVLSNLGATELPEALMLKFCDLYLGRPQADHSANFLKAHQSARPILPARPHPAAPPLPLRRYVGIYRNPAYGDIKVKVRDDLLVATLDQSFVMHLRPWHRDTFTFEAVLNRDNAPGFATFQLDQTGEVVALKIPFLFSSPGGLFYRFRGPARPLHNR